MERRSLRFAALEGLFWGAFALVLLPLFWLFGVERQLESRITSTGWTQGWSITGPSGQMISENVVVPQDLRFNKGAHQFRDWTYSRALSITDLAHFKTPALLLGRIGDADSVHLGSCHLGSTGLQQDGSAQGWWWGSLRLYVIPTGCLTDPSTLEVSVHQYGVANQGIYAGPIGIGEWSVLQPLVTKAEFLRFYVFAVFGILMAAAGLYYLFVFLLVPGRLHNGVFGGLCLSTGLYELSVSCVTYRFLPDAVWAMRINFFSAAAVASFFIWFLSSRFKCISRKFVAGAISLNALVLIVGCIRTSLDGVFQVYQIWFPLFLLQFLYSGVLLIRHWLRNRPVDGWRYVLGTTVFISCCLFDVAVAVSLKNLPYLVPYGFVILLTTSALALAKEYADAFLHVEAQVTERTGDLTAALVQLRAMEQMKARVYANISHDFKTPITIAMGYLEEAAHQATDIPKRAIASAQGSLTRLGGMITDLLETVRVESGEVKLKWETVTVGPVVRSWVTPYQVVCDRKKLQLDIDIDPKLPLKVPMDPTKMHRVVENLLSNAIKFTDKGTIRVRLRTDDARMYIEISDSGIGIKEEERKTVFDRFTQGTNADPRTHGGTGIGLSFVREMIDLHRGRVWADESEFGGSKFVIALPLSQDVDLVVGSTRQSTVEVKEVLRGSLDVAYPPMSPEKLRDRQPTILVVEDNPEIAQIIYQSLRDEFNIFFAQNGAEALKTIEKTNVECVLTDLMMPVMDGTELLREIRSRLEFQTLPVIVLTSRSESEDVVTHLKMGANDFVTKPFQREVLAIRIRILVEKRRLFRQLMASDKMVTLGLLSSGISHEIRNPLTSGQSSVGGAYNAYLPIHEKLEQTPKGDELVELLRARDPMLMTGLTLGVSALSRIETIVQGMKGYATGSRKRVQMDLKDIAKGAAQILAGKVKEKAVTIDDSTVGSIKILGYPTLHQVMVNLLDNALDAVERDVGRVVVTAEVKGDRVTFIVEDNGAGIPTDVVDHIFDPFVTTKAAGDGTGLGLYIVRDIVCLHHAGEIQVSSTVGRGTKFIVDIPLEAPETIAPDKPFHGLNLKVS